MLGKFGKLQGLHEKFLKILFVVFLAIDSFGCATVKKDMYEQPDLPIDQVALINTHTTERFVYVLLYAHFQWAQITIIDEKPTAFRSKFQLLPGQHEIVAYYRDDGGLFFEEIDFHTNMIIDVKAGREYQIRGGVKEGVVRIWVEDIETKAVVGMSSMIPEKE